MSRPCARIFDKCTGHDTFNSRSNNQGSPNVMCDGRPRHRFSDSWMAHSNNYTTHKSNSGSGSDTVFTNGLPQARMGDIVLCGGVIMTGSNTTFIN